MPVSKKILSMIRPHIEITEESFPHRLLNFVRWNYDDVITEAVPRYPYTINTDSEEGRYDQVSIWFACSQVNPRTGAPMIDEFVERFVEDRDLASKLLQAKEMAYDRLVVLGTDSEAVTAASTSGGGTYRIRNHSELKGMYPGSFFTGFMHPWGRDGTYTMCGEVFIEPVSVISHPGERIYGIRHMIVDCSPGMIDAMCAGLNIDCVRMGRREKIGAISSLLLSDGLRAVVQGLPRDERDFLRKVAGLGGTARHLDLDGSFVGASGSAVNGLEEKALLVPGLMEKGGKVAPAVIIAGDVLANLHRLGCLGSV